MDFQDRKNRCRRMLGIAPPPEKKVEPHSSCCGVKMEQEGGLLVCRKCAKCKKNLGEYTNKPESQKSQFSASGSIQPGVNTEKTADEKNAVLNREFSQLIISNGSVYDFDVLGRACDLFRKLSVGNVKKCENRKQLIAACYWYCSIFAGNIVLTKDVIKMFKLEIGGTSKGLNILTTRVLVTDMSFDVSPITHPLIIQYFLKKIRLDGDNLLTKQNEDFCDKVIRCMIDKNISYDTEMLANCAGVVYYLLRYRGIHERFKKNALTKAITLNQNIYNNPYNLLMKPEVNRLLPAECQLNL